MKTAFLCVAAVLGLALVGSTAVEAGCGYGGGFGGHYGHSNYYGGNYGNYGSYYNSYPRYNNYYTPSVRIHYRYTPSHYSCRRTGYWDF